MTSGLPCPICEGPDRRGSLERSLRVLAVDDEAPALEDLVYLLRSDPRIAHVEAVTDATKALRVLHRAMDAGQPLDAVFLDIRMPGLDGLDLARVLSRFAQPPPVVFVTAHQQPAVEAFELKALDYLLKPVRPERLAESVHRIVHEVWDSKTATEPATPAPAQPSNSTPPEMGDEVIPVELGGVTRFIRLADIRYVEAHGDYARLHTATGSGLVRAALNGLEERWRSAGFVRIHRSHLVSLGHIDELRLEDGHLSVTIGGAVLPVSRRHARHLRQLLVRRARPTPGAGQPAGVLQPRNGLGS
ncbi:LytR/AlgR family response regulator transcription factor [Lentzea flaviverrucosa]|uniref:Two component transcriptional regulator, LytTR family n=1 Tax=Lentzea flaviverrucosa TaxID=200379 RepID=A0A1H9WAK4_9PSEU|nr:LytTR family DNA-binding domain-containing protein [Lentzea flaviverrucosa]RDI22245.1 LytTR family two component transcriptional regulator [Lentzea flaviverrucosa]SES30948.1 two component transcriptional regulator, LytTR family [Lentzea flaviverrucosa]